MIAAAITRVDYPFTLINDARIIPDMKLFHRWIIAVLLMLCLPLQGMAAVALPIGMTHETPVSTVLEPTATDMSDHCMQHASAQHISNKTPEKSTPACDNCFTCHLSVAQALVPIQVTFQPVQTGPISTPSSGDKIAILTFPFFRPPISA